MSEREFTAYVIVKNPEDHQAVTFEPGDVVPEWALDVVGDHVTAGVTKARQTPDEAPASDDAPVIEEVAADEAETEEVDEDDEALPPYTEWSKTDLRAEVDGRELDVPSKATIADLVAALEADDAENPEED